MAVRVNTATFDFNAAIDDVKNKNSDKAINKLLAFGKIFTNISSWQIGEDNKTAIPVFIAPKGYEEVVQYKTNNCVNIVYKRKGAMEQYAKVVVKSMDSKPLLVEGLHYDSRFNFEVVIGLNGLTFCFDKKVTSEEVMESISSGDIKTKITA